MKRIVTATLLSLAIAQPSLAQETIQITPTVIKHSAPEDKVYPLAADIISRNDKVEAEMRGQFATLSITLVSKFDTVIELNWVSSELGYKGKEQKKHLLMAHVPQTFNFVAYAKHDGDIRILDEEGTNVLSIPYLVKDRKKIRQSVSFNAGNNNNSSINYRRTYNNGLSFNGSISKSENNTNLRIGVNYTW